MSLVVFTKAGKAALQVLSAARSTFGVMRSHFVWTKAGGGAGATVETGQPAPLALSSFPLPPGAGFVAGGTGGTASGVGRAGAVSGASGAAGGGGAPAPLPSVGWLSACCGDGKAGW
jgi:hypothetical protein